MDPVGIPHNADGTSRRVVAPDFCPTADSQLRTTTSGGSGVHPVSTGGPGGGDPSLVLGTGSGSNSATQTTPFVRLEARDLGFLYHQHAGAPDAPVPGRQSLHDPTLYDNGASPHVSWRRGSIGTNHAGDRGLWNEHVRLSGAGSSERDRRMESSHEEHLSIRAFGVQPVSLRGELSRDHDPGLLSQKQDGSRVEASDMDDDVVAAATHAEGLGIATISKSGLCAVLNACPRMHSERPNNETDHFNRNMLRYIRLFIDDTEDARVQLIDGRIDKCAQICSRCLLLPESHDIIVSNRFVVTTSEFDRHLEEIGGMVRHRCSYCLSFNTDQSSRKVSFVW